LQTIEKPHEENKAQAINQIHLLVILWYTQQ
jgi:hypothetical protein